MHGNATTSARTGDPVDEIRAVAGPNARISFVSGNFNVVHPGHLRLLTFARENSDFLVVAVNPDTWPGVAVPAALRVEGVRAIGIVNFAFLLTEPLTDVIKRLKPDIVVKGREFQDQKNAEQEAVASYDGELLFSGGEMRFTAIGMLEREYNRAASATLEKPVDYPFRHGFDFGDLRRTLDDIRGIRVLVLGDLIVDRYIDCDPLGMSQEDPTIVVTPIEEKTFVGGAGIVAAHARGIGADVRFITVAGGDQSGAFARKALDEYDIDANLLIDATRPTTLKQRYRASGKTLLRVNILRQHGIQRDLIDAVLAAVDERLAQTDLILFSDFNYGFLTQSLVDAITERAEARGVMMAADSQASSQIADVSRFGRMKLLTPTEREARLALNNREAGLVHIAEGLRQKAKAENVIVTLGGEGLLVQAPWEDSFKTDQLPAFNPSPKDIAGAGDALFCATSLALRSGASIWLAAYLGSLAAGCQVGRLGNTPLSGAEIVHELDDHEA